MGEPVTGADYEWIETKKDKYTLKGLNVMDGLNGKTFFSEAADGFKTKMYKTRDNDISEEQKKTIKNYLLDVVIFDQQGNTEEKAVDNFIRLNQNAQPIICHSFEVWNSCDIPRVTEEIKEIAKYKGFKQNGKRMKEEELVTIFSYAESQNIGIENMEQFFSTYKRLENKGKINEHYEVQISIKKKQEITKFLEKIRPNTEKEERFLQCVHSTKLFCEKLKILSNDDANSLIRIFNPNIKSPRKGNPKDFYISWIFLKDLDIHFINTYKTKIFKDLEEIFHTMKNLPEGKDEKDFIKYVKAKIDYYESFLGNNI